MCGRFTLRTPLERVAEIFEVDPRAFLEVQKVFRFNVAPTQDVVAVRMNEPGRRQLVSLRWGMIPSWAPDASGGAKMINARSESVAEKPSFRELLHRRRCLVPADGFFEWKKDGRARHPYYVRLEPDRLFAFAGLWDRWIEADTPIESCTLITTSANEVLRDLHDRMPVMLEPDVFAKWLDPNIDDPQALLPLLVPHTSHDMVAYPVSSLVNSPQNDQPECIDRVPEAKMQRGLF